MNDAPMGRLIVVADKIIVWVFIWCVEIYEGRKNGVWVMGPLILRKTGIGTVYLSVICFLLDKIQQSLSFLTQYGLWINIAPIIS